MKHQTVLKPQRAYVTRRNDADNSLWVQEEAERLALIDGDADEAKRRRDAAMDLKKKRRRVEIKPLPAATIEALGPRDAISNMLKERFLEERHGRTVLHLRDYMVRRQVTMSGGGNLVFVDGGAKSEMIDRVANLRRGEAAIAAGERTLSGEDMIWPVTKLVCGFITIKQAARHNGGNTDKAKSRVRSALKQYLEAAEPFFS